MMVLSHFSYFFWILISLDVMTSQHIL